MKRIAAVIMALLMVIGVASVAFANETYTITVTDDRTYEVYQIFTGDLSGTTLSNVKWGKNGTGTEGVAVDANVLEALGKLTNSSDTDKLTEIEKYVNFNSDKLGTVTKESPLSVAPGYYLLKDVTELGDGQEESLYVVKIVANVEVKAKAGEVTSEKKVKDKNDSTGVESEWQDSASYDIGDDVPFKLSATITNQYANYKHYYLAFHDTLSEGLTFNADSVKVKIDGTTVTSGYELVTEGLTDGCTFEVVFNDLKNTTAHASSVITVEYTAKLNEQATIGSTGNDNKMNVEYSNNPNDESEGKPDEPGKTPEDKVVVFTYKLVVNKVDQEQKPLTGAGFTLYKKVKDETAAEGYKWEQIGEEIKGEEMTTFEWKGLDDGDYKLVETTTPAGYNTMADIEFTIDDTIGGEDNITLTGLVAAANNQTWITGTPADGKLETDIVNNKGTILPETGAQGTVMFITFGSIIAVAAVVLMVTRKKMSVYED